MRVLLTGSNGFVGTWLRAHLVEQGDEVHDFEGALENDEAVRQGVRNVQPEIIYHLAGQADVASSWSAPELTYTVNTIGTLRVLEAARALLSPPRVLVVSSAEVYGKVTPADLPLREERQPLPVTPYGASKLCAEVIALQSFRGWGLPTIVTRAFNHIGPGQSDRFVVSALARQIAEAERSGASVIEVGNLSPRRDFTDVRDVARAYRLLGINGEPGEVYNVCTGADTAIEEIVQELATHALCPIEIKTAPDRLRPVDVPLHRGDPAKLIARTGWSPEHSLGDTLNDVLRWWRTSVASPVA